MIIVELFAGLGNQMFQYAAGRALAEYYQVDLKLNCSSFVNHPYYIFDLGSFNIQAEPASPLEIDEYANLPSSFLKRLGIRMGEKLKTKKNRRTIVREYDYHYQDILTRASRKCYLFGHFQSEKYFKSIENIIRSEFTLHQAQQDQRHELIRHVSETNSVSLTVRRGDYLKYPELNLYGENLTFFYKAMDRINDAIENPFYFIFSDDIDWVKEHLKMDKPHIFVSESYEGSDYKINPFRHQDLLLMSHCKHNIITNSSYAWWGAWLNPNSNKIVIAPSMWFKKDTLWYNGNIANTKDIIPGNWIKI